MAGECGIIAPTGQNVKAQGNALGIEFPMIHQP